MIAIAYLLLYLFAGLFIVRCLLPQKQVLVRGWLGLSAGLVLLMWLPAVMAFFVRFSVTGHMLALIPLVLLCGAAYLFRDRGPAQKWGEKDRKLLPLLLIVSLPLTVLGCYLAFTHIIEPGANGSLHVGQTTYGDLNLHLSIITSMRNAAFPADYSIFPGELLAYPFLTDTLSTTFMLFGFSLRNAVLLPTFLMLLLVFSGYMILCTRIADSRKAAILAALFFFINGGLGFVYMLDMQNVSLGTATQNELQAASSLMGRIKDMMNGYYMTPTNHAEFSTYNLRWSNVIVDMLIPQRTTMGGWCILLPCLYLLFDFSWPAAEGTGEKRVSWQHIVLLGAMAGALPMIHTHSFLALAMISAGFMAYSLIHAAKTQRVKSLWIWAVYALITACLAVPQLLLWTFHQAMGSSNFFKLQFNWVNNLNGRGLQDGYIWFYLKNIGLPFLFILLALFEKNKKHRFLASGAFVIFIISEFILFQPNEYDNNKLFYVWYMLAGIIAADYAVALFNRLKGFRSCYALAVLAVFVFFCSGVMSIARECVSDYQLFAGEDVAAAEFAEEETPEDAVFMTYYNHINPISSLAGRTIVCGPALWLQYHGFNLTEREAEISAFYAAPGQNEATLRKYGVSYIYVGPYERANLSVDYLAINEMYDLVYESEYGTIQIYKVEE